MVRSTRLPAFALLPAILLAAEPARAQTTAASAAMISASGQAYPDRIVNAPPLLPSGVAPGADLGESTRAQNLTPLGINHDDCISDMVLSFEVVLSGFDGSENLQVWASKSSDCTAATDRGALGAIAALCWPVAPQYWQTGPVIQSPQTVTIQVRVQDLVGPQNAPPFPPTYTAQGAAACNAQPTFAAVPMTINFVPVDSSGNYDGTAYQFAQPTDLIGPPAPTGLTLAVGDTLLFASWGLNVDSDTAGYDLYIDPIPGHEGTISGLPDAQMLVCPDTGASSVVDASVDGSDAGDGGDGDPPSDSGDDGSTVDTGATDASDAGTGPTDSGDESGGDDGGDDGSDGGEDGSTVDAGAAAVVDAGCYVINVGGSTGGGACSSVILTSGIVQDSGAGAVEVLDEDGDVIESDAGTSTSGSGGISTIPSANLIGVGNGGVTVPDKSTGSFTIEGLKDNSTYTVVVAAVDGFGNIGPPSTEACSSPAPIEDFWKIYRDDGGMAGGGLCALEEIGAHVPSTTGVLLFGGCAALLVRRRIARRRVRQGRTDARGNDQ
jgi:hypothetical protein